MKYLCSLVFGLSVFAASAWAGPQFLKATVTGTVTVQSGSGGTEVPQVSVLDNERLLAEFGVTKQTHAVVWTNGKLQLRPKGQGTTIVLCQTTDVHQITNDAAGTGKLLGTLTSAQNSGLFADFSGMFSGKINFSGEITQYVLKVIALGTDPAPPGTNFAHLKFTMTTGAPFVPQM